MGDSGAYSSFTLVNTANVWIAVQVWQILYYFIFTENPLCFGILLAQFWVIFFPRWLFIWRANGNICFPWWENCNATSEHHENHCLPWKVQKRMTFLYVLSQSLLYICFFFFFIFGWAATRQHICIKESEGNHSALFLHCGPNSRERISIQIFSIQIYWIHKRRIE